MAKKKNTNRNTLRPYLRPALFTVLLMIGIGFFIHTLVVQHGQLKQYEEKNRELNAAIANEQAELDRIREELDKRNTDEYIEQRAREMGFVKPGEKVFIDVSGN